MHGTLLPRAETDLTTAAGERVRAAILLRTQLQTAGFSLAALLVFGLPFPA